jgi:hypothetical protein
MNWSMATLPERVTINYTLLVTMMVGALFAGFFLGATMAKRPPPAAPAPTSQYVFHWAGANVFRCNTVTGRVEVFIASDGKIGRVSYDERADSDGRK